MQTATVCSSHTVGFDRRRCEVLRTQCRPRIIQRLPAQSRRRLITAAAGSSGPKGDGFSGRDFLAEFDDLLKFKPADKEQQQASTSSALSDLFKVMDEKKKPDDSSKSMKFGTFKSLDTEDKQPKAGKVKKERITKKFFGSSPGKMEVKEIVDAFKLHEADVGSSQVQVALLTQRIKYVATHLKDNKKDFSSQRGLRAMVEKRKKHLLYLRRTNMDSYKVVIAKLGLKDNLDKARLAASGRRGR
ncbi:uncharacterized protein LOC9638543 [Selaginella moellendorffii]|uniref:uncharacterized protein LOC9638543 n=1 Tax=Selaginella moellendorffii TaxID=88036 RepID=UPI000D1C5CD3|nr:uncharacterized protein LOC9638543 [Selaginella moellendorffii]|eukprot:XP_002976899.2 uncharacterized protein LOC9638543 [Selaginella moellendorffii]